MERGDYLDGIHLLVKIEKDTNSSATDGITVRARVTFVKCKYVVIVVDLIKRNVYSWVCGG